MQGPHPSAVRLHGFPDDERNLDLGPAIRRGGRDVVMVVTLHHGPLVEAWEVAAAPPPETTIFEKGDHFFFGQ